MCADCPNSTDLQRNYDAATDRCKFFFAEMNVAARPVTEPGSNHVAWARNPTPTAADPATHDTGAGAGRAEGRCVDPVPETGNARRSPSLAGLPHAGGLRAIAMRAARHLVAGMDHQRDLFD